MLPDLFTLRRKQHCSTCGKPDYPRTTYKKYCLCTDCDCGYCQTKTPKPNDPKFKEMELEAAQQKFKEL